MDWMNTLRDQWRRKTSRHSPSPPPAEPEVASLSLLTQSREDIFDICYCLMTAVELEILQDPAHPLIISLIGTRNGGKSIFRDATRLALLGNPTQCSIAGCDNAYFWWRADDPAKVTVGFYNAKTSEGPRSVRNYIRKSVNGGVLLISNGDWSSESIKYQGPKDKEPKSVFGRFSPKKAGMNIKLESTTEESHPKHQDKIIVIEVRDPRLLSSDEFMNALRMLGSHKDENGFFVAGDLRRDASAYPKRLEDGAYHRQSHPWNFRGPASELDLYEMILPTPSKKSFFDFWRR